MARKKVYDDDDGRPIADMSQVGRQRLFLPNTGSAKDRRESAPAREGEPEEERPWEAAKRLLTKEERRWYMLGALKAALLIAGVFIVAFGLVILLMILAWK